MYFFNLRYGCAPGDFHSLSMLQNCMTSKQIYVSFNTSSREVMISYWSTIIVSKTHNSYMELGTWIQVLLLHYHLVVELCLDSYSPSFLFGLIAAAVEEKVRSFYERVLSE